MTDKPSTSVKLAGRHTLNVGRARAWAALHDIESLQALVPGCEAIRPAGDDGFELRVAPPFGPLGPVIEGRLRCSEVEPLRSYRVRFEGGSDLAGHGEARARIRLAAPSRARTLVSYDLEITLFGPLALMGPTLIELAARQVADEFFVRLAAALKRGPATAGITLQTPAVS